MLDSWSRIPRSSPPSILGGSWDLATTCNWAYSPTYNWANLHKASQGELKMGF